MRLIVLVAAGALACVLATTAHATVRPVNAQDRALLARPATSEEQIAEQVARRLTGHKAAAVRCGPIGESSSNALGVTPLLHNRSFDYFIMRPAECTYLSWFIRRRPAGIRAAARAPTAHMSSTSRWRSRSSRTS